MASSTQQNQSPQNVKEEVLLQIPDYRINLVEKSEPLKLALSFSGEGGEIVESLEFLEDFKGEKTSSTSSTSGKNNNEIDWKEFSPKAEEYKSVVAKAIAGGTGHIIKGIFTCSNSYSKKLHKGGGETTIAKEAEEKTGDTSQINGGDNNVTKKKNKINTNLQRVEKLWKASETIGATELDVEEMVSGSMIAPMVKSKLGKALLSTAPGEILLASLDSFSFMFNVIPIDKILGAAEAAETQTHAATSMAATKLVSKSFGENAGKTTGKILETTSSLSRAAWNIQKALDPSFSIASEIVKHAPKP